MKVHLKAKDQRGVSVQEYIFRRHWWSWIVSTFIGFVIGVYGCRSSPLWIGAIIVWVIACFVISHRAFIAAHRVPKELVKRVAKNWLFLLVPLWILGFVLCPIILLVTQYYFLYSPILLIIGLAIILISACKFIDNIGSDPEQMVLLASWKKYLF